LEERSVNIVERMAVHKWINGEFKDRLLDDEWLKKQMEMLVVGRAEGEELLQIFRCFLAAAVCDAAGMSVRGN
jgi:hypothetical protein